MASTSSVNFLGSYSGITSDTVDQLIEAESTRLTVLQNDITEIEDEQSAWKDIGTRLTNLVSKLDTLDDEETYETKTVTNSNEAVVSVAAGTEAVPGNYSFKVTQLATQTKLTGATIPAMASDSSLTSTSALSVSGTLTFDNISTEAGAEPVSIDITADDSVKTIVQKINDQSKNIGVSVVSINNKLVFTSTEYGDRTLNIGGTAAESLGINADATMSPGQSALFSVNGIAVERSSNTLTDVVDGLTITLNGVSETAVSATVAEDTDTTVSAIQSFVDQYNSTLSFIADELDVGDPSAEDNETGALVGDGTLMRLQSSLRSLMSGVVQGADGSYKALTDIGISVDREGTATLDTEKLQTALKADPDAVKALFYNTKTTEETIENADGTTSTTSKTEETGIAQKLNQYINSFVDASDGIIATKNKTYDSMIEDLNEQIDTFNERLEAKRARYIEQFTALDTAMMEAESQLSYLNSQLGIETE